MRTEAITWTPRSGAAELLVPDCGAGELQEATAAPKSTAVNARKMRASPLKSWPAGQKTGRSRMRAKCPGVLIFRATSRGIDGVVIGYG